jgi:hypothetical protein
MVVDHQWNDFDICVKCLCLKSQATRTCPGHYDNPDNEQEAGESKAATDTRRSGSVHGTGGVGEC